MSSTCWRTFEAGEKEEEECRLKNEAKMGELKI